MSTHTLSIEHATSLAYTTKSGEKSTEARAQGDTEISEAPGSTAKAQGTTELEPWDDRQMLRIDERCASHGPIELPTRRNAARQVRGVRGMLGMR